MAKKLFFRFGDCHTGGYKKTQYDDIYIQADSEDHAVDIFKAVFGLSPFFSSCSCCGPDFSCYDDGEVSLAKASEYQREDYRTKKLTPLRDYVAQDDVCVIVPTFAPVTSDQVRARIAQQHKEIEADIDALRAKALKYGIAVYINKYA